MLRQMDIFLSFEARTFVPAKATAKLQKTAEAVIRGGHMRSQQIIKAIG